MKHFTILGLVLVLLTPACLQEYDPEGDDCDCDEGYTCDQDTGKCVAQGQPASTDSWDPPVPSSASVTGRLWVMPNPIRYDENGSSTELQISIANIGSATVQIERVYIDGPPGLELTDHAPLNGWPHRIETDADIDCGNYGGMGFPIPAPTVVAGQPLPQAQFVVETNDPTSPTVRVDIIPGPAEMVPERYYSPESEEAFLVVKPNPIVLDSGGPRRATMCINAGGMDPVEIVSAQLYGDGIELIGPSPTPQQPLVIEGIRDWEFEVRLIAGADASDGTFVIAFIDTWGDELSLAIPVIVR